MSAAPERREPIDIEEFERRLRAPPEARRAEDPLADLARLLGEHGEAAGDPFAALFGAQPRPGEPARPAAPPPPPVEAPVDEPSYLEPRVAAPQPETPPLDFPDLRPLLRGGDFELEPPAPVQPPHAAEAPGPDGYHPSAEFEDWAEADSVPPDAPAPDVPHPRSRKPLYVAAAVIAAGFVAIGATLAWRGGGGQAPSRVAVIKAATTPAKIQPKAVERADNPARDSTMLEKAPAPAVKGVVTREEQPVDVAVAAKTPRIIPLSDDASPSTSAAASAVPAPPPPLRGPATGNSAFPEPKRVKTVSVRADGSIISDTTEQKASPPPAPPERPAAAPQRNATPKTAERAASSTPPAPRASRRAAEKPKAKERARAEPQVQSRPAPEPAPARVAAAPAAPEREAAPPPRAASGDYAVQLAAPGSEAAARTLAARLGEKYAGALGGGGRRSTRRPTRPSIASASRA